MKLGADTFVAKGRKNVGKQLFDTLMGPDSPVPPTLINVRGSGGSSNVAVAAERKDDFRTLPGKPAQYLFPKKEKDFDAWLSGLLASADRNAVRIHQRGYGLTDARSTTPWLSTGEVAPCIAVMIHDAASGTGALAHFDANMNDASVTAVVKAFAPESKLDVSFFGGMDEHSIKTCTGLLQALYDMEQSTPKPYRFTVRRFDVIGRPHSTDVTLDTTSGEVYPSISSQKSPFDSEFRRLPDGRYLIGGGAKMADLCEATTDIALRDSLRDVRGQFDGRGGHYDEFRERVEAFVYGLTATTALERTGRAKTSSAAPIVAALKRLGEPRLIEANLQRYLGSSKTTAGDEQYAVEVIVIATLNELNLDERLNAWLAKEKARPE
jgi:hypothetical protein